MEPSIYQSTCLGFRLSAECYIARGGTPIVQNTLEKSDINNRTTTSTTVQRKFEENEP